MSDEAPYADTGDEIRAAHWDMYKGDGSPEDRLEVLLSALGTPRDAPPQRAAADLRRWLDSAAAIPAPVKLITDAKLYIERYGNR